MNSRAFTFALVIAALSMWMVYSYVKRKTDDLTRLHGTMRVVVVAKEDINEMDLLTDDKMTVDNIPQSYAMPGHFEKIKDLENFVALVPIRKGEQITGPRVSPPGMRTGLARQVSVGKRAFALNISDRHAVGKLIKPGDRVDVVAAIDYASGDKELARVQTVIENVLVLSTGRSITNTLGVYGVETPQVIKVMKADVYADYNTVTLELEQHEAQKLIFIISQLGASPFLTLRNNNDDEKQPLRPTKLFDIVDDYNTAKHYFEIRNKNRVP